MKTSILDLETVELLREKVVFSKATVKDFETIEEFLEAFGKPRSLVLREMRRYGMLSYEEYLSEYKKPVGERPSFKVFASIKITTTRYLDSMADYFIRKQNISIQPEIWELKNPETV